MGDTGETNSPIRYCAAIGTTALVAPAELMVSRKEPSTALAVIVGAVATPRALVTTWTVVIGLVFDPPGKIARVRPTAG